MNHADTYDHLDGIAIIGMSGRFPGAKSVDEFWHNLRGSVESIALFSAEELASSGIDRAVLSAPNYVKAKAVLEDAEWVDAAFFGFTPRDAEMTDPQHRLFLECAWEALENAGYNSETYKGLIGVYAGASMNTYLLDNLMSNPGLLESVASLQTLIGNDKDHLPTRVSYKLNLRGPSINVQTACSTSLVAVHLACQSLLNGECDMALAGGVSITVPIKAGYFYQEGGICSPDGHCRAFDASAQGTVSGNGVGIIVLKRLADALTDGDCIHAVIKGSAINNDGSLKVGYTAPSVDGQAEVIAVALAMAGVEAETVTYIETHGTGTALGDPIEIAALTQAFRVSTARKGFCAIGSVKTNIGHLDTAAGITGLIKAVLALKHKELPPSLHFKQPNPKIDFANSPFYVNTTLAKWETGGLPRRAGVSSFGIGGTNAHVILEEAPPRETSGESRPWQLLVLSTKTGPALETATTALLEHLKQHAELSLADVAYSLQVGRKGFSHRRMLLCRNLDDAVTELETLHPKRVVTHHDAKERPVALMFPGQGTQYVNMGLELYRTEHMFRKQVDYCSELLTPNLGIDLRHVLYPSGEDVATATHQLKQTFIAQPALFVVEYALAKLWMAWGVRPQAMIGHSIGEYVAACLAGVFSLEDALALVGVRGRLMQHLPGGAMLAVALPAQQVQSLLGERLSLAAINAPSRCTVSGPTEAVERLEAQLIATERACHRLHTSHAFHSGMMEPMLEPLTEHVSKIDLNPPRIPYISNLTGTWITAQEATDPGYWARHLRRTVCFAAGVMELCKEPERILLEVGPGRTLSTLAGLSSSEAKQRNPDLATEQTIVSSMLPPHDRQSDVAFLLNTLGQLWLTGLQVDWPEFYADERRHRLPLPAYPFERQRFWVEPRKPPEGRTSCSSSFHKQPDIADWFYLPSWKRSAPPMFRESRRLTGQKANWLMFADTCSLGTQMVTRLEEMGQDVFTVTAAEQFAQLSDRMYTINPLKPEDYETLLKALRVQDKTPNTIVHLWGVGSNEESGVGGFGLEKAPALGFYSLLFLAQALGNQQITDSLHLAVVTSNMQAVTGEEVVCPEKATVLGPCKIIPQEYPNITCRSIDIAIPDSGTWEVEEVVDQLIAELAVKPSNGIVAYRGVHRWVPTFETIRLEETEDPSPRLRKGGTYLITGGLGGIGLALAEYLARTVQAKLVLTGRSGLPPRDDWGYWLSDHATQGGDHKPDEKKAKINSLLNIDIAEELDNVSHLEKNIERDLQLKGIKDYEFLEETINELCSGYVYDYLLSSKIDTTKGRMYQKEQLKKILRITPNFAKFFDFMINVLAEDRIIKLEDNTIEFLLDKNNIQDPRVLKKEAEHRYPGFKGLFDLLEHCANHYGQALTGEILAISVLYPEGSPALLEHSAKNTVEHSNSIIYQILTREIISQLVRNSSGKKLRILEIGAGNGNLTWKIAETLKNQNVVYHFTDLGKSFVINAEKEAVQRRFDFMNFGILDVSDDPVKQGYKEHDFDIILGLNVVHATRSIEKSMEHLKRLLAPNGIMLLIELVKSQRWIDMIWGLAAGWWYFDDDIRTDSPLLSLAKWEEVIQKQGFKMAEVFPKSEEKRLASDCGLIVVQQETEITMSAGPDSIAEADGDEKQRIQYKIRKVQELEELGSEVMVAVADVANLQEMQALVNRTYRQFGRIHGVIHAAGVPGGGLISTRTRDAVDSEFASRVTGTVVLDTLFKHSPLDFLLLCSSLSSVVGGVGQVSYCAANNFVDMFAQCHASHHGTHTVSVSWDRWQHVGMAVAVEAQHKARTGKELAGGMTSTEGIEVFRRILQTTLPQVVVSTHDLYARINDWDSGLTPSREVTVLEDTRPSAPPHARPAQPDPSVAPKTDVEKTIADIWQKLFGIEHVGIHDDFLQLGGDSLLATQLLNKLRQNYEKTELSMRNLFDNPTVAGLAQLITKAPMQETQDEAARIGEYLVGLSPADRRSVIEEYLQNRIAHTLGIESEHIPIDGSLVELDFESITAHLIWDFKRDLQLRVYPYEILKKPSIRALARFLVAELDRMSGLNKLESTSSLSLHDWQDVGMQDVQQRFPQSAEKNKSMIFLLSAPRSGSTLLRLMLAGHSALFCPPELGLLDYHSMKERSQNLLSLFSREGVVHAFVALTRLGFDKCKALVDDLVEQDAPIQEVYRILQQQAGVRTLVDKTPGYAMSMKTLERAEQLFAEPKYIYLVRHPYPVIESFVRNRFEKLFVEEYVDPYMFAEKVWLTCNGNILDFLKELNPGRYHLVHYENLVREPTNVMSRLCEFLGVSFEEAILHPYEGGRMINGPGDPDIFQHDTIDSSLAEVWKKIRLPRQLSESSRRLAAELNYELPVEHAVYGQEIATPAALIGRIEQAEAQQLLEKLDQLSDAEVDSLLRNMLDDEESNE